MVYHYSFKRHKRDDRTINAQITKAEQAATGKRPVARDRFVKVTTDAEGKKAEVNWDVIDRARAAAGLKGYVTNIPTEVMDGAAVVVAYHDLWHVEESFRMAKNDLQAWPIFHRKKDSIEALIRSAGLARAYDEPAVASSKAFRFAADSIPASATTTSSVRPWRALNCSLTGSG